VCVIITAVGTNTKIENLLNVTVTARKRRDISYFSDVKTSKIESEIKDFFEKKGARSISFKWTA